MPEGSQRHTPDAFWEHRSHMPHGVSLPMETATVVPATEAETTEEDVPSAEAPVADSPDDAVY